MKDTSVELKGLELTAESVRRREEEPLALLSSDRLAIAAPPVGILAAAEDGRLDIHLDLKTAY